MNKVEMMGNMTRTPEIRYTQTNNKMVANFGLAVRRDAENTDFFNCTAFGKTAELISKYCSKGSKIAIVGRLQNRQWEDDKGKHYATDIIIEEVHFAGNKKENTEEDANTIMPDDNDLPF